MNYLLNNPLGSSKEKEDITQIVDIRIDKSKHYIYFENEEVVMHDYEIAFKDIIFNFSSGKEIENTLNDQMDEFRKSISKEGEIPEDSDIALNEEGIYNVLFRDYEIYEFGDYITVLALDSSYDVLTGATAQKLSGYTFSENENRLVSESEILKKYEKTIADVTDAVKDKLDTLNLDGANIDVNATINDFKNYKIYSNKIGDLEVRYLVKSNTLDYFDTLVIK